MSVTMTRDDAREQESRKRAWRSLYRTYAARFLRELPAGATFTGEDLHSYISYKIGKPHHPNCWGSASAEVIDSWRRSGEVRRSRNPAKMKGRKAHGRITPVYRKPESLMRKIIRTVFG